MVETKKNQEIHNQSIFETEEAIAAYNTEKQKLEKRISKESASIKPWATP